ncbi:MAG: Hsp20/alpha crystallin family protein [Gammaproteobacteria bacterium]|jgi:HSP20 family protein
MSLVHYKPVNLFDQINDEMNRYFSSMRNTAANQEHDWTPAVDIQEDDNRYVLTADIPGVNRNDVEITLEEGVLTVKGERKSETGVEEEAYRRRERIHGTFLRQFNLPDTVDTANISAKAEDGVLKIAIPKQEKPEPRRINVA